MNGTVEGLTSSVKTAQPSEILVLIKCSLVLSIPLDLVALDLVCVNGHCHCVSYTCGSCGS